MNGGIYSELDYLILAMVGNNVSSGYAMRKQMNSWRGSRWSSESGSVYRVLRRLERDGLVHEARKAGVPNRERTEYEITARGDEMMDAWLTQTPDPSEFGFLVDPIRTRSYFLNRLEPADRIRTIKTWTVEARSLADEIERDLAETPRDALTTVAYSNLLHLAQARVVWLRRLLAVVKDEALDPASAAPTF